MMDYLLENGIKSIVFWLVGFATLCVAAVTIVPHIGGATPSIESEKWQAVFLTNNQVYFGKLNDLNADYVTLTDVYYLQTATELSSGAGKLNLIKLGGEVHGPEDTIYIPKRSVLFFENMKDSSQVVETIKSTTQ